MTETMDLVINEPLVAAERIDALEVRVKLLEFTLTEIYKLTDDYEVKDRVITVLNPR